MRKLLAVLLAITIMSSNFIFVAAEGSGGNGGNDNPFDITYVSTSYYDWDLYVSFESDGSKRPSAAKFLVEAKREENPKKLTFFVKAEITEDIPSFEEVIVQLGDTVDNKFNCITEFPVSDFEQYPEDNITKLELYFTLDLEEEELSDKIDQWEKIRLLIPAPDDKMTVTESVYDDGKPSGMLTATHGLIIPDTTKPIDGAALIETDFLDVLGDYCTADSEYDDWPIPAGSFEEDGLIKGEINISFDNVGDIVNKEVTVNLLNEEGWTIDSLVLKMKNSQSPTDNSDGFWISPNVDEFVLSKGSIPIRFQLVEAPSEVPVLYVYEADNSGEIPDGDPIGKLGEEMLAKGNGGKHAKGCGGSFPGTYYKYNLKTKNLTFLEEGGEYMLAVMVEDELLYFEGKPAILTFTVAESTFASRWDTKLNVKDSDSRHIKYEGYNRGSRRN